MASVPTAHLVLFIAAVIVSASIGGVIVDSAERYGDSLGQSQSEYAKDVSTEIQVINDPGKPAASYEESTDTLTLYVKNVGDRIIPSSADELTVLVNGTPHSVTEVTVHDDDRWRPGTVAEVRVTVVLPSNSEVRVVVEVSGGRDHYEFTAT